MLTWNVNKPANTVKKLKIPSMFKDESLPLLKALLIKIVDIKVPTNKQDVNKNFINEMMNVFLNVFFVLNNFPKKALVEKKINIDTIEPNKKPVKYV